MENGDLNAAIPADPGILPQLLDQVTPVHAVVPVDFYIPGCPPPAIRRSGPCWSRSSQAASRPTWVDEHQVRLKIAKTYHPDQAVLPDRGEGRAPWRSES